MKLIKNLPKRLSKNGKNLESWAIFWCDECKQEVEKRLSNGKKHKSCGRHQHYNYSEERNKKISIANKGKKRTEEQKKKYSEVNKGKKLTKITKQKIREANIGKKYSEETNSKKGAKGELNPNWKNGSSPKPYGIEFNKELKQQILERDNYICQNSNCGGNHKKLHVHHIDYDKKNNSQENLITLCHSCHMKSNGDRLFWSGFYQEIIKPQKYLSNS